MGTKLNRKGRVSLPVALAASSMLALALTLSSCSGEDGKNGKDGTGTSCTLDGKVLTCGDKTLTIKDGEDGEPGGAGPKGETGIPCTLEQDEEGKGPAVITCGDKTLVIPMCDGDIYSLAKNVCDNDGNLYDIVKIGAQTWM
ncbi:MAG: hypothetical protein LBH25_09980, partial [Fibromonadaceae bacterium]|nr:hypothetical protein [Fibromonadaceae bacterium]